MRCASVATRLDRLASRGHASDAERTVRQLAEATGLTVEEVRAEWKAVEEQTRRFGPRTVEQIVRRCAEGLGLPEAEVWAEYRALGAKVGS